ncbi:hypothetical protein [Streptomyces adelaidensis]|uniref:hypothetical protein n=1 Tax=Streptomyces adelaidensis TaxID=2796465 RepID=UPI0019048160|nr:hypothetical protein [Streptomyces adelaidensis]
MDTQTPQPSPSPRPLRHVTATATATGSALAVALLPLLVGALVARSVGGDPMASVNALITGGGQRARLSRSQLPVLRSNRNRLPVLRSIRGTGRHLVPRRLLPGGEDVRVEVAHRRER